MNIYNKLPRGFVRHTVATFLTKREITNVIEKVNVDFYNSNCETIYDMMVDYPDALQWERTIKSYDKPDLLEFNEHEAAKHDRCIRCFKTNKCSICQLYQTKKKYLRGQIMKKMKQQELLETELVSSVLQIRYRISYDDPDYFYDINEIIDYWKFDVLYTNATFKMMQNTIDTNFIDTFKNNLSDMRLKHEKQMDIYFNKLDRLHTKWCFQTKD
tara:strand:- start:154 stop:795 length:642 start_codon:yes stop_codon:yes gene_type:complete